MTDSPFNKFRASLQKNTASKETGSKKTMDPVLKPASDPSREDDVLGAYPSKVRVPVLEGRRYLWTTRVFAIGFYVSMLLNIALVMTIYTITPLKRVQPFLVTFDDQREQVVHIQPFQKGASGMSLFTEKQAAEYVKIREEILLDSTEQQRRWVEYMRHRMPKESYVRFLKWVNEPYKTLTDKGISRKVDITRINRRSPTHIEVIYKTTDQDSFGNKVLEQNWLARLQVTFRQRNVTHDEQYFNPLGFTVLSYSVVKN